MSSRGTSKRALASHAGIEIVAVELHPPVIERTSFGRDRAVARLFAMRIPSSVSELLQRLLFRGRLCLVRAKQRNAYNNIEWRWCSARILQVTQQHFVDKGISRNFSFASPARSPELTPMDF
ncbi:hypothetical protein AVEN_68447-1 [Araneus ventricosus]|uniref:Uncharacterized protein n=1 Tax=Araneus ventricosus TaxID=182803 RepID=A0A4Y2LD20_ARAVE|nr:hypothetical protein AVEN_68447-1 [Araneus ventricosus]